MPSETKPTVVKINLSCHSDFWRIRVHLQGHSIRDGWHCMCVSDRKGMRLR